MTAAHETEELEVRAVRQEPRPPAPPALHEAIERAARLHGVELPPGVARRLERPAPPPEDLLEAKLVAERASRRDGKRRAHETIPAEFRWCRLDAPELMRRSDPSAVAEARAAGRMIVTTITGKARQGKTSLATAIFVDHLEHARPPTGFWTSADDLIVEAVRETKLGNDPELLERARRVQVLLLDELGAEPAGDAGKTLLEQLIAKRHREHKPTIVTTGLTSTALREAYSFSVFGRLTEPGRALVLAVNARGSR